MPIPRERFDRLFDKGFTPQQIAAMSDEDALQADLIQPYTGGTPDEPGGMEPPIGLDPLDYLGTPNIARAGLRTGQAMRALPSMIGSAASRVRGGAGGILGRFAGKQAAKATGIDTAMAVAKAVAEFMAQRAAPAVAEEGVEAGARKIIPIAEAQLGSAAARISQPYRWLQVGSSRCRRRHRERR